MKNTLFTLLILSFTVFKVNSQEKSPKFEIGFNLNEYHADFGVGVHVISPYFLKSRVAVKLGASQQWLEHTKLTETTWTPYQNFQLGLRSRNSVVDEKLYFYGEGGVIAILPNANFSSKSSEFGGYGLFGFEFKSSPRFGYFLELGGVGTGAIADKVTNKPIYSNGFLANVGFRFGL